MGERTDEEFMMRAIELASRGEGLVSPNPMVGAVVVKNGQVFGEGFHQFGLLRHAESYALEMAGTAARGSTLYCNLEPCSHHGRTPPCTISVIESGVSRVVIGMIDPDPRVNGRGIEQLKEAGVEVAAGVLEKESALLNDIYVKNVVERRPFIHQVRFSYDLTERGDWLPSEKLARMASRYDALAVGTFGAAERSLLSAFLNREWHREPIVFADAESTEVVRYSVATSLERSVLIAPWTEVVAFAPEIIGSNRGERRARESLESIAPTSILALPGAEVPLGSNIDVLTLVCEASKMSNARAAFSKISSQDRVGELVEITGYPCEASQE